MKEKQRKKTLDRNQLYVTVIFHGERFLLARLQVAMSFCAYGDQYLLIDKFHKSPDSDSVLTCPIFCITFEISQNGKWIAKTVHSAWFRRISNVNSDKRPEYGENEGKKQPASYFETAINCLEKAFNRNTTIHFYKKTEKSN